MYKITINPTTTMDLLSRDEVKLLTEPSSSKLYQVFRNCALAVLNCGSETDNVEVIFSQHQDFDIAVIPKGKGVKLELTNPPKAAFVDGEIIHGINEHLFAVLRDILFVAGKYKLNEIDPMPGGAVTNLIFDIFRNAQVIKAKTEPSVVVCWGGHSISLTEYKYTKKVGYQLGLRGLNICTGCGPGAMKGPMKGATIGHAKQRLHPNRYIGLTEPGIIAAEPPNPIVNQLVILPDIEKRLEGFIRLGHAIVIFPGGPGTAEELLYLLCLCLHPKNKDQVLPIILSGPSGSANYFDVLDNFIGEALGAEAQACYEIIIDDALAVAKRTRKGMIDVRNSRRSCSDAYHFNWALHLQSELQTPFSPTHKNMAQLRLDKNMDKAELAANLRRAFSGIVAGNIKPEVIKQISLQGPFQIHGDPELMQLLDKLLQQFVDQGRMKLENTHYEPCYRVIT